MPTNDNRINQKRSESKKNPNCNQNHSAKYSGCSYFQKSKEILNIKVKERLPLQTAKKIWHERERIKREANAASNETFETSFPILPDSSVANNHQTQNSSSNTGLQQTGVQNHILQSHRNHNLSSMSNNVQRNSRNMVTTGTQTTLTVSDIDTVLIPNTDKETARNVASVLLEFVDILHNTNVDQEAKKSKLIKTVTSTFGFDITKNDEEIQQVKKTQVVSNINLGQSPNTTENEAQKTNMQEKPSDPTRNQQENVVSSEQAENTLKLQRKDQVSSEMPQNVEEKQVVNKNIKRIELIREKKLEDQMIKSPQINQVQGEIGGEYNQMIATQSMVHQINQGGSSGEYILMKNPQNMVELNRSELGRKKL